MAALRVSLAVFLRLAAWSLCAATLSCCLDRSQITGCEAELIQWAEHTGGGSLRLAVGAASLGAGAIAAFGQRRGVTLHHCAGCAPRDLDHLRPVVSSVRDSPSLTAL